MSQEYPDSNTTTNTTSPDDAKANPRVMYSLVSDSLHPVTSKSQYHGIVWDYTRWKYRLYAYWGKPITITLVIGLIYTFLAWIAEWEWAPEELLNKGDSFFAAIVIIGLWVYFHYSSKRMIETFLSDLRSL